MSKKKPSQATLFDRLALAGLSFVLSALSLTLLVWMFVWLWIDLAALNASMMTTFKFVVLVFSSVMAVIAFITLDNPMVKILGKLWDWTVALLRIG